MKVIVTERRFPKIDPYKESVERAGGTVIYGDFKTEEDLIEGLKDATVVVTFKAPITRKVIESLENCRLILRNGAGFDNVDIRAANEHGIPVSSMRGYVNDELSEHVIALMLAAARDIPYADKSMRDNNGWGDRRNVNYMGHGTFGVVGLGEIGRTTVPKAKALGMKVIGYDPYVGKDIFELLGIERVGFKELIERSDCVSVNCQLTAETHHMFSTEEFKSMKNTAVIVNTARGPIIDEQALVNAVESGEIYSAGLDVFETEPPENSPALSCERIVCSPHHGATTPTGEDRCITWGNEEIVRALKGEALEMVVNPEALWYQEGKLFSPEGENWSNARLGSYRDEDVNTSLRRGFEKEEVKN